MEQATDPGADLDDFLGAIDGAVVDVKGLRKAAFVEGGAESFDKGIDVFSQKELAVAADAGSVIEESDEASLKGRSFVLNIRADEGVGLPHFIGVGFGESQAQLVGTVRVGLEHFVLFDQAAKGVGRDLGAG
jgi:hypothetical protein